MRVLDGSYNPVVVSDGREVIVNGDGAVLPAHTTAEENFISNVKMKSKYERQLLRNITQIIDNRQYIDKSLILGLFPIFYKYSGSSLYPIYGSGVMVASGDYTEGISGINGGGTVYFDTQIDTSAITDINNFAFGVVVMDNTNVGTDIGVADATNYVSLATRSSGNTTTRIGTASDTFATTDSTGHWIVNVSSGNFTTYLNAVEVGNSTPVAGSLPSGRIYLGAVNNSGGSDYSTKTYGFCWFYNGGLTTQQIADFDYMAKEYSKLINRYNG